LYVFAIFLAAKTIFSQARVPPPELSSRNWDVIYLLVQNKVVVLFGMARASSHANGLVFCW
jgi:hypothetical protein